MENASKALIIAGAILLAILLISLGIMIFNQAQSVVDGSGMSEAELSTFNSKFTKYEGTQKGSVVKSMINEIESNNANSANEIKYNSGGIIKKENNTVDTSEIENNKTYTVKFTREKGRISGVIVTEKKSE